MKNKAIAYVDGSYNKSEDVCGWGIVFIYEDEAPEYFSGSCEGILWNVSGEIHAAVMAVEKALEYGCDAVEIHYDYNGIESWVSGMWKAKKEETQAYRDKMRGFFGMIDIGFVHVKGHSGDKYNDKADELAKTGSGILKESDENISEKKEKKSFTKKNMLNLTGLPEIGEGINPNCRNAITLFLRKRKPQFKDFMELKVFGLDKYSRLKEESLTQILGKDVCEEIRGKVNDPKGYLSALRWAARGLSAEDASKKANVDMEIAENCYK